MIPIGDENPSGKKPYVVYLLVAINVFVYVAEFLGARVGNLTMVPWSVIHDIRAEIVRNPAGQVAIAKFPTLGPHPQWITIFTSMFMHAGLLHIAGNMLYLWIFGNNVEDALGHIKFLLFYLACGVLAALAHIWASTHLSVSPLSPFVPTVGASGAIAGVLGAYIYLYPRNKIRALVPIGFFLTDMDVPAVIVLGIWFVAQFLGLGAQSAGGVAYGAHVGGFLAGVILIALLGGRKLARPQRGYYRRLRPY